MKLDLCSDKGFLEVWNRGFAGRQEWGQVVNDRNQSQYLNMKISYKNESLIYESVGIMGVRLGINKMQVEHNQGKIYMNSEHMVEGSEVNKR